MAFPRSLTLRIIQTVSVATSIFGVGGNGRGDPDNELWILSHHLDVMHKEKLIQRFIAVLPVPSS